MPNPWKICTLAFAAALVLQHAAGSARAEDDPLRSALGSLRSAEKSLASSVTSKRHDGEQKKGGGGASPRAKALDLTRAAILQVETSLRGE